MLLEAPFPEACSSFPFGHCALRRPRSPHRQQTTFALTAATGTLTNPLNCQRSSRRCHGPLIECFPLPKPLRRKSNLPFLPTFDFPFAPARCCGTDGDKQPRERHVASFASWTALMATKSLINASSSNGCGKSSRSKAVVLLRCHTRHHLVR